MSRVRDLIELLQELPEDEEIVFQFLQREHIHDARVTPELWSQFVAEEEEFASCADTYSMAAHDILREMVIEAEDA